MSRPVHGAGCPALALGVRLSLATFVCLLAGCPPPQQKSESISRAWPPASPAASNPEGTSGARKESSRTRGKTPNSDASIATVQGSDIPRSAIVDLLLKSHGAGLLEQLIGLEVASQAAAKEGIQVTDADVAAEYERALRKLMNPEGAAIDASFDRDAAEKALYVVLAERSISPDEFMVTLRRNACLRKIVEKDLTITDEMIRDEYARTYGERVRVRHIQVSSLADADRILQRLASGEKFEDLAAHESVNSISARRGGLLPPFSMTDDNTPEAMRRAAFALKTGKVSSPIRAGQWYQILKLEERIPAETPDLATAHDALEHNLRERLIEARTRALYDKLVAQVIVTIHDPVLKEVYESRNPPPK
ncbi:MAG: peptidyl-prolyl cis-trans isomerase [Planctomycetes bacterium]|nr:peptidyl-prolyl cis-trans isomerase [Planctomycetota bacterium]MBI3835616.1 peptidyl-prolyl cis-trans isomerase [Planctomycetota bacterium]